MTALNENPPALSLDNVFCAFQCDALFNTYCFLFAFLPAVLIAYWSVPSPRWRSVVLVVSGFLFYSLWDVRFTFLLLGAAVVDFWVGLQIGASPRKRFWLGVSLVFNLGMLAFFKYAMFAAENARSLLAYFGSDVTIPYFTIVLPIGISFFTFKTLSYTIDVYRGTVPPTRDFLKYLAFISLFPELVAGPIVRWQQLKDQFDLIPRRASLSLCALGATFFVAGLFKKVVIADSVARIIEPYWAMPAGLGTREAWIAALGYTLQLYFDFSGYSDMAIGLGAMLGFCFPINFRAPYQALNPSDFWRRWHVSLSQWLRDYLYIPLGGSRMGETRTIVNLMVVMTLGGFWHGAAWTFVLWGVYHGVLLVAYRLAATEWDAAPAVLQRAAMLLLAVVGWVVFRAPDVSTAAVMLGSMLRPSSAEGWFFVGPILAMLIAFVLFLCVSRLRCSLIARRGANWMVLAIPAGWIAGSAPSGFAVAGFASLFAFAWFVGPTTEMEHRFTIFRAAILGAALTLALVLMGSGQSPFLYYQF